FQAEDGIRDRNVTGVQTCALPIFRLIIARDNDSFLDLANTLQILIQLPLIALTHLAAKRRRVLGHTIQHALIPPAAAIVKEAIRSEERRVGKEVRMRTSALR